MARLLVVHHSPTTIMRALTDTVLAGANDPDIQGVTVVSSPALETTADDVLAADGLVLGTTANFGYMSGALKHFFDSTFLRIGGALGEDGSAGGGGTGRRLPYGLYVHGRYDTSGAVRSVQAICSALPWEQSAPVLECLGDPDQGGYDAGYELGGTIAALLTL